MNGSLRVAALQLRAHDRSDFANARERIIEEVRRMAARADLLVLPEATFPAYVLGESAVDETEIAAALDRLREIAVASQSVIVVGAAARSDGRVRNGAFAIDADGSLAGRADKLFLWHFDRRWFAPGDRIEPIRTAAGTLGVLVCADGRLPTIARTLVDRGAQLLVMPTAWVTSGRNPEALENVQADLLARVRAYENRVPFIAANKCGSELAMVAYCGKSQIVDSAGEIVALASERAPETLHAEITLAGRRPARVASVTLPVRQNPASAPLRLAIAYESLPNDIDERLDLLDDAFALSSADPARRELLDQTIPLASVRDE